MSEQEQWRAQQREAAQERLAGQQRREAAETERARELVAGFVEQVRAAGPPPVPLRARGFDGRDYRTGLTGWYVRRDRSAAVGTDGRFYVLSVGGGLSARLRGARVEPSDPPLVLGAGGRDGDSVALEVALRRVLEG